MSGANIKLSMLFSGSSSRYSSIIINSCNVRKYQYHSLPPRNWMTSTTTMKTTTTTTTLSKFHTQPAIKRILKQQQQPAKAPQQSQRIRLTMNHSTTTTTTTSNTTSTNTTTMQQQQQQQQQQEIIDALAQKAAYARYGKQQMGVKLLRKQNLWIQWKHRIFGSSSSSSSSSSNDRAAAVGTANLLQRNMNTAWYALAIGIGALGASYAAVPLYKVFCQTTGFGGTTQRVLQDTSANRTTTSTIIGALGGNSTDDEYNSTLEVYIQKMISTLLPSNSNTARVHTWTDVDAMERLRSLKPLTNSDMITIRFDTTVTDIMPWSFVPVQLDVKVVPGETALSFFRVTNHSNKAITGVATYNVHPPKVGVYFQKIQCFCFEEQRLLPGETVDMPVFFFIDPDIVNDPQVSYVRSITLSYTFFPTDEDDDVDVVPLSSNKQGNTASITATIS